MLIRSFNIFQVSEIPGSWYKSGEPANEGRDEVCVWEVGSELALVDWGVLEACVLAPS